MKSTTERDLVRDLCKNDLFFLAKEFLGYKDLVERPHREMCERISAHDRPSPDMLWMISRGFFKTTIFTIAHTVQLLLQDPGRTILIASDTTPNAKSMVWAVAKHLTSENFEKFFPEFVPKLPRPEETWNSARLILPNRPVGGIVKKEGNVDAMSTSSEIVSRHYDWLKFDDMVTRENSKTKALRDEVKSWIADSVSLKDRPETPCDVIGTNWHDDDAHEELKENSAWECWHRSCWIVQPDGTMESAFPSRFPKKELLRLREKLGLYKFSCLYENSPVPTEGSLFKKEQIHYFEVLERNNAKWAHYTRSGVEYLYRLCDLNTFTFVDAATDSETAMSKTAIITVHCAPDFVVLVRDVWLKHAATPAEIYEEIKRQNAAHSPIFVNIETVSAWKILRTYILSQMRHEEEVIPTQPWNPGTTKSKDARISAMQPSFEFHRMFFQVYHTELISQILKFPNAKYKDGPDALSQFCEVAYFPQEIDGDYDDEECEENQEWVGRCASTGW